MRELYNKVNELIGKIDFTAIWSGFLKHPFALYDKSNVYLQNETIPHDNRFVGNTSIEYDGEYIAIWFVDESEAEDPELLAAAIVHEMFHAFQQSKNEERFPNDLLMLDYPENEENYAVKHCENLLLVNASKAWDIQEKKGHIEQFISARKYRESLIGNIIKQEYLSETIEGMAEYVGCMALRQLAKTKYEARIRNFIDNLSVLDNRFFDIRRMSYYSGAMFCIQLAEAKIDFFHDVGSVERPLFSLIAKEAAAVKPGITVDIELIARHIQAINSEKEAKFKEFLSSHHGKVMFDGFICGYDPMNMIKLSDKILCSHFVMLQDMKQGSPEFIQGPVLVNMKPCSINQVSSYVR